MSSASASIFSSKVLMESSCRFQPAIIRFISKHKAKRHQIIRNRNLQLLGASLSLSLRLRTTDRDKNMVVCCSVGSGPSIPSNPGAWKLWVLGILLSIALPFWRSKSGPLLKLKDEVETVIDKVEAVTDYAEKLAEQVEEVTGVAEKVSEEMEKVADEIGNHLPEGRLKDALEIVEHTAQNTAEGARFTGEFINKVKEVESWMKQNNTVEEANKTKEEEAAEEVETVIDKAEAVMDIAEKVAEQMEKVADDIGNHLPDGRLKDALQIVEDMAQNTAEGAHVTGELISKVEEQVESWIQQINFVEEAKKTKEEDDGAAAKGQA